MTGPLTRPVLPIGWRIAALNEAGDQVAVWISRAGLAHQRLRALIHTANEAQQSAIFMEIVMTLNYENLNPRAAEPGSDWKEWAKIQLDYLWMLRGTQNPRRWALQAQLMLARLSGAALLGFLDAVRAPGFQADSAADTAALMLAEHDAMIRRGKNNAWVPVPEVPDSPVVPTIQAPLLHRSQRKVFERCVSLGRLHYSGMLAKHPLQPRTSPIIVGGTGSGKSHVAREVAKALNAHFLPLTFGRWVPFGVRDCRPTSFTILQTAKDHERVVVLIDEIDKAFAIRSAGEWGKVVLNEIFLAIDRQLPLSDFAVYERSTSRRSEEGAGASKKGEPPDVNRIWFMGGGTWQEFTGFSAHTRTIGFGGGTYSAKSSDEQILAQVRASNIIPVELLARFHADPLLLRYPEPDEIPTLLSAYGLDALAAQAGVDLSEANFDFSMGGMRVFEALAADLALKVLEKERKQEVKHER